MEHTHTEHQSDLRDFVRVIRSRKWSILLVTAGLTAAALVFSFRQTPVYEGSAKVLVEPLSLTPTQAAGSVDIETEQGLVGTQPVAQQAVKILGTHQPPASLLSQLSVDVVPNTQFLLIHYSSADPAFAARAANAFANAYIKVRQDQATGHIEGQLAANQSEIRSVQKRLDKLNKTIQKTQNPLTSSQATAEHDQLVARLAILEQTQQTLLSTQAQITQGGGEVVNSAGVPTSPVSPNHVRTATLALVLGLALGTGVAFLRERLDDSIRTHQELERRLGAPVLATVPRITGWRKRESSYLITLAEPKNPVSESYRTLRTNLQFIASTRELKTLMVTSATVGDGKSATATNLAVADASILARHADGTLFVVDADTASRAATSQARQQLEHAGADLIGAVFNKYDPSQAGGYSYYYYYDDQRPQEQESRFDPSVNGDERASSGKARWGWSRRVSKAGPRG